MNCRLKLFDTILRIKYQHLFRPFYTLKKVYTKTLQCCREKKIHSALVFCKFLIVLFPEYQSNSASITFLSSLLHFPLVLSMKTVISIIKIRSNFIFSPASCSATFFLLILSVGLCIVHHSISSKGVIKHSFTLLHFPCSLSKWESYSSKAIIINITLIQI